MKQLLLLLLSVLTINGFSQNMVKLNIDHKLGNIPFALNTGAKNNLGHDFDITRLEYYLSKFTIVHDGGLETNIDTTYALVNASEITSIGLGSYNITSVEAVKFHIGVDSATNHLDPATYPRHHALAPQFPSMHWGWAGGYRFAAVEGNGSSNYNQVIQLHGVGDDNYFQAVVPTSAMASNNELIINIDADYTRALEDISVNGGIVLHGFGGAAQTMLLNFSQYVFGSSTTSSFDLIENNRFDVFPNPTSGHFNIVIDRKENISSQILITNILGETIKMIDNIENGQITINEDLDKGIYFIQLMNNNRTIITRKLVVK